MSVCAPIDQSRLTQPTLASKPAEHRWYAVFTAPKNEKSVERQLMLRNIECFLPTYEVMRLWKNRQRAKVVLPLFPNYLFVHINRSHRSRVLQSPGVLQIVGNAHGPIALPDSEIEFLQSDLCRNRVEPCSEFVVGQRVRVCRGMLEGVEGTLVRKNNRLRFVLTLGLISQHAMVEVDGGDIESLCA